MTNDTIRKNLKRDIQGMKTAFFIKLLACVCGASLLLISGCANAPLDELDNAKTIDEMNAFAARVGITPTVAEWHGLAEQGDATAQVQLGWMYNNGEGVVKDDKQAAAWYRKAAEQGHIDAQYNLGLMYSTGEGVAQDYKLAYVWSAVAAANGDALAANNRDIFAKSLSPAALAEAQTVAGQYVEQYQPKQEPHRLVRIRGVTVNPAPLFVVCCLGRTSREAAGVVSLSAPDIQEPSSRRCCGYPDCHLGHVAMLLLRV